jgi:hypothetical protein
LGCSACARQRWDDRHDERDNDERDNDERDNDERDNDERDNDERDNDEKETGLCSKLVRKASRTSLAMELTF